MKRPRTSRPRGHSGVEVFGGGGGEAAFVEAAFVEAFREVFDEPLPDGPCVDEPCVKALIRSNAST